MKLFTLLIITIVLTSSALAQTPATTSQVDEEQVNRELHEAAEEYRKGNFEKAQAHSERALLLNPQNKTAPYFIARTIHAQFKPGVDTPENAAKARLAIVAYQKILERIPGDEESYKAVAYLYSAIKEDELLREWVLQRAGDVSMSNEKRAEAFVVLASRDWDCSFTITELPGHKVTTVRRNRASVRYQMPKELVEFDRANECAKRGLEMANIAITLTPDNVSAWSYKTNILLELSKLAEMSGETQQKIEFQRQYEEALEQTSKLAKQAQSNP